MKIVLSITNDVLFDQRMQKICTTLHNAGHSIILVGKNRNTSLQISEKPYEQIRLQTIFKKGKLFYLEFNLRLFFCLFKVSADAYCANDTDTLWANWLVCKILNKPLFFDAHEYFTEMEEVVNRPFTKWAWKKTEDICIPSVHKAYTISQGYASLFEKRFKRPFQVILNTPTIKDRSIIATDKRKHILYQGAVNYGRGLEELIDAMLYISVPLVICGNGDALEYLKQKTLHNNLSSKITFTGYLRPEELIVYTEYALVGITLFSNHGLSNHYSLCNRFFDYIHCGVPQLAMKYPEYESFNKQHEVALLIESLDANTIASNINNLLSNATLYNLLYQNSLVAREHYNWQKQEQKLINIYSL